MPYPSCRTTFCHSTSVNRASDVPTHAGSLSASCFARHACEHLQCHIHHASRPAHATSSAEAPRRTRSPAWGLLLKPPTLPYYHPCTGLSACLPVRTYVTSVPQRVYRGHRTRVLHGARLEMKRSRQRGEDAAATKIQVGWGKKHDAEVHN